VLKPANPDLGGRCLLPVPVFDKLAGRLDTLPLFCRAWRDAAGSWSESTIIGRDCACSDAPVDDAGAVLISSRGELPSSPSSWSSQASGCLGFLVPAGRLAVWTCERGVVTLSPNLVGGNRCPPLYSPDIGRAVNVEEAKG